ncbi:hypothetical protein [Cerasicoccus maritimus]|uniref:hypothetical protein n=1 Tax=Cerasicoccus maritimus TaxID=490089 RepID=UPI0028525FCB|nr:hypothetical protein [Cerasicoccus maritimus]
MTRLLNAAGALIGGLLLTQTALANDWLNVDDFENHQEGQRVDAIRNWTKLSNFAPGTVVKDGENRVAQIGPGEAICTRVGSSKLTIPEGATGIIYLRFRTLTDSRYWGGVFGLSGRKPTNESDLNVGWSLGTPDKSRPNATFTVLSHGKKDILVNYRGRMNKAYEDLGPEIKPGVWYDLWVTIDNSRDEIRTFIQGGDFVKRTELSHFRNADQKTFQFQTASASDLSHFVIMNPTEGTNYNPRTIQVDNINFIVESAPSAVAAGH